MTDFDTDPYISTVDAMFYHGIISLSLYQNYTENKCKIYWQAVKESYLPGPCVELASKVPVEAFDIYDLIVPPEVNIFNLSALPQHT